MKIKQRTRNSNKIKEKILLCNSRLHVKKNLKIG